jgi:alkylation response protein AidB-like acyl-CoA dehydrogenase
MIVIDRTEHDELRAAVRKLLEHESPMEKVAADASSEVGYDPGLWRRLASDIGVAGLAIPERFGGSGATIHEQVVVAEELGRTLACTPYLATVALGVNLLLASGDEAACEELLPGIARGDRTVAVVYRGTDGRVAPESVPIVAHRSDGGWQLEGHAWFVLDGHSADVLLVLARTDCGCVLLFSVAGDAPGLERQRMDTLDHTRSQAKLAFTAVPAVRLGEFGQAWTWFERTLLLATVTLAAEQVGGADRALETAVEYAKLRVQFGRKIGSFQAIKHRCAEIAVENDRARSAMVHATWAAVEGDNRQLHEAAAMAALVSGPAFVSAAQESIQIHGGIGFTWEHPAHRYLRRAKANLVALDDPRRHEERLLAALGV